MSKNVRKTAPNYGKNAQRMNLKLIFCVELKKMHPKRTREQVIASSKTVEKRSSGSSRMDIIFGSWFSHGQLQGYIKESNFHLAGNILCCLGNDQVDSQRSRLHVSNIHI